MCPLALTTAAMACACGPMSAIDFSGPAAKANPTSRASQPATTSAIAPAILDGCGSAGLVVVEMLNAHPPCLELAHDIGQTVDPSLQSGAAEAGFCVEVERKKLR